MINAHPVCMRPGFSLPKATRIIICHGSKDKAWPCDRSALEGVMAGDDVVSRNNRMLYYVGCSGQMPNGGYTRTGDSHNMAVRSCIVSHMTAVAALAALLSTPSPPTCSLCSNSTVYRGWLMLWSASRPWNCISREAGTARVVQPVYRLKSYLVIAPNNFVFVGNHRRRRAWTRSIYFR